MIDLAWEMATPHTRGSTLKINMGIQVGQGYPAYAGIDPLSPLSTASSTRLPRIRGDRPSSTPPAKTAAAATPHTRGSTWTLTFRKDQVDGYPAYAGIDPLDLTVFYFFPRLPRIRGDRPISLSLMPAVDRATPHTRGSTPRQRPRQCPPKGYPAYAGIDPVEFPMNFGWRWLPRIRGDRPHRVHDQE